MATTKKCRVISAKLDLLEERLAVLVEISLPHTHSMVVPSVIYLTSPAQLIKHDGSLLAVAPMNVDYR